MARLWQSGFELNSVTAGVEFTTIVGSPTIQNTTVRTGGFAGRVTSIVAATAKYFSYQFSATDLSTDIYARFYFRAGTLPNGNTLIASLWNSATNDSAFVLLSSAGLISLGDNNGTVLASSKTLVTGQWYRIEIRTFKTSNIITLLVDGVTVATESGVTGATETVNQLLIGANIDANGNAASAGDFYFDDIAINDATGGNQNSFPGAGQIIHLQPNAAGDNNAFATQTGGTAGSANNFTRASEVTPDDVTTFNGDITSGHIDDFNLTDTPSSIGAGDTINVVAVGVRYRASVATAVAAFQARIKKAASGTVSSSSAITPNSTTWGTNANAAPKNYPLVTYQNPDAAAWTKALLDTAQVGVNISTTGTNRADISTLWVSVDSTPVSLIPAGYLAQTNQPSLSRVNSMYMYESLSMDQKILTQKERVQVDKFAPILPDTFRIIPQRQYSYDHDFIDTVQMTKKERAQVDKFAPIRQDFIFSIPRMQYLYDHSFLDAITLTKAERPQVDKFAPILPDTFRILPQRQYVYDYDFIDVLQLTKKERPQIDKFQPIMPPFILTYPKLQYLYDHDFIDTVLLTLKERVTVDKFSPIRPDFIYDTKKVQYLYETSPLTPRVVAVIISPDKYAPIRDDYIFASPKRQYLYESSFIDNKVLSLRERVSIDKFAPIQDDKYRDLSRLQYTYPALFIDMQQLTQKERVDVSKFLPINDEKWRDLIRLQYLYPYTFPDNKNLTSKERVSLDKFRPILDETFRDLARLQYGYPSFFIDMQQLTQAERPDVSKWQFKLPEFIPDIKRLQYFYPNLFIDNNQLTKKEVAQLDKWAQPTNQPVFDYPRLQYLTNGLYFIYSQLVPAVIGTLPTILRLIKDRTALRVKGETSRTEQSQSRDPIDVNYAENSSVLRTRDNKL